MGVELYIKRMQVFTQIIYEITSAGETQFENRYISALDSTLDVDMPEIISLCKNENHLNTGYLDKVSIEYSTLGIGKKYIVEYRIARQYVFTVDVVGEKTNKRYILAFDDASKKEDVVIETFFEEWSKAFNNLKTLCVTTNIPTPNKESAAKFQFHALDVDKLCVNSALLNNGKYKTILMGVIKSDNRFKLCISWKGKKYFFDMLPNDYNNYYTFNFVRFLSQIPLYKNYNKVKNIAVILTYTGVIKFVCNPKSSASQFIVSNHNVHIGRVELNSNHISTAVHDSLKNYPFILTHINDWKEIFIQIHDYLYYYNNTSNTVSSNSQINQCQIDINLDKENLILKWEGVPDSKYLLYKKDTKGKVSAICTTMGRKYTIKYTEQNKYDKYAVIAVNMNNATTIHYEYYSKLDFQGISGVVPPQISKTDDIKVGDVYYYKQVTSCGHHFWKVTETHSSQITIRCTECGAKKQVFKNTFTAYYNRAYHSSVYDAKPTVKKEDVSRISFTSADVIVLHTSKRCTDRNHEIIDYIGILPIVKNGKKTETEVSLGYCRQCDKYIMLTTDYTRIKNSGTPVCEVRDLTSNKVYNKSYNEFWANSAESVLHQYGYNVRAGNGLSSMDRQQILLKVMGNGVLSKNQIISHLEYCINMASGRLNMDSAIRKWSMDLDFVRCYNPKAEHVAINSITLKYSKKK